MFGIDYVIDKQVMRKMLQDWVCGGCGGRLRSVSHGCGWRIVCEACGERTPGYQPARAGSSSDSLRKYLSQRRTNHEPTE